MQKSIAFKILLISWFGTSLACESEKPSSREVADKYSKPSTNNLAIKKKRALLQKLVKAKKKQEANIEVIEGKKKEDANISFPYILAPDFAEFQKTLSKPIGKISGQIFGQENDVYAVLKTQCGEGTILQAVFKDDDKFQVSPPIPVRFIGLATQKAVTYSEERFNISVNFTDDNQKKLKGNFRIDFIDDGGNKRNYINLLVDGAPHPFLLPTKMKGSGTLPSYDWCAPTAYVGVKQKEKDWRYGYAHVTNLKNFNLPQVRVMLSDRDGLDILLIPLKRGAQIPPNTKVDIATARQKGKNPAVLKIESWRIDEIDEPKDATGVNLKKLVKTSILDGDAEVSLQQDDIWKVDIRLNDFSISPVMVGPFSDESFSEIRIFGNLGKAGSMESSLPEQPAWWKAESSVKP